MTTRNKPAFLIDAQTNIRDTLSTLYGEYRRRGLDTKSLMDIVRTYNDSFLKRDVFGQLHRENIRLVNTIPADARFAQKSMDFEHCYNKIACLILYNIWVPGWLWMNLFYAVTDECFEVVRLVPILQ